MKKTKKNEQMASAIKQPNKVDYKLCHFVTAEDELFKRRKKTCSERILLVQIESL